uniref:UBX domain-containing protein n=1 Tax=Alexandrium monilatum TaxID=311494 RepID=A0A7S4V102_9DINO
MEHHGQGAGQPGFDPAFSEVDDPELAAAIEASYRTQTQADVEQSEDQMLAQAMHLSRLEEEERRRRQGEDGAGMDGDVHMGGDVYMGGGSSGGFSSIPSGSPYAAGSASSAAGSASSSATGPSFLQPPRTRVGGQRGRFDEDEEGSDAAVAGGSSRGSSREPGSPRLHGMPKLDEEMDDPHLAAAIEASYAAQTELGMESNEEDMIQQALRISQMEEESRQRSALKEQQEAELQESLLMDQMREQEEKRRRVEEEEIRALEASRAEEEERRRKVEQEEKRARVPPEPAAGEPGRVDLQIRTPEGKRVRRAFRGTDTVGQVYDYIDVEGVLGEAFLGKRYRLVSTMPRREYEDRVQSLQDAGLSGQCALLMELSEA